ncbi:transferase [Trypanosoma cruzi]|nr:transferase [Trypanosoma cruzi]
MDFDDPSNSEEGGGGGTNSVSSGNEPPSPAVATQVISLPSYPRPETATPPMAVGKRNCREVQSFVFDDDNDDGGDDDEQNGSNDSDKKEIMRRGLERASYDFCEGHLHHQLVESAENVVRPLARHGCDALRGMGRLGDQLTEVTGTHELVDDEEGAVVGEETEEEEEEEEGEMSKDMVESDDKEMLYVEENREWDSVLRTMSLVDVTLLSHFYVGSNLSGEETEVSMEGSVFVTETMVKTISLFYTKPAKKPSDEAAEILQMAFDTLHRLALHMRSMQQILTEAGLTIDNQIQEDEEGEDVESEAIADRSGVDLRKVIFRGVHSLHVDSSCRLIGVIDIDACTVSLSDVVAFSTLPFSQQELVAILKSVIQKVAVLHDAGFVHGCLHSGNVLCCTDDGRTVLTGACGIMSNPLLPADASFISPRLARALQPFVKLVWSHHEKVNEETFPWTLDPAFHRAVLERYGCTSETEMRPKTSDDIYAIGILVVTCLLGVSPFHSATLKEVVETLSSHNPEDDDDGSSLLGNVLTSNYALQRFRIAGYTEAFIASAKDFVHMCLSAASNPAIGAQFVAENLLTHSFFVEFPIQPSPKSSSEGAPMREDEVDEAALMDRTVHCLLYPIFLSMDCVKKDCGTTPLLPRLLRNSIFASRWDALHYGQSYHHARGAACKTDTVGILWPSLERRQVLKDDESQGEETAVNSLLYRSLVHAFKPFSQKMADSNTVTLTSTVESKGMRVDVEAHALVFSGKSNNRLVLYRDEVPVGYGSSVDTLILQDLENCAIEILMGFRFVLVFNVRGCELLLGPCHYLYFEKVFDCAPVIVSSAHLLLRDVSHVNFHCGGGAAPRTYGSAPLPENVTALPYTMAYAGLTADFAAVSLPQEHIVTMLSRGSVSNASAPVSRTIKLYNMLRGGFDYPYSHALAAFGTRFTHENDGISNLFLFFSEVAGKSVRIAQIHGDQNATLGETSSFSPKVSSRFSSWPYRHGRDAESELKDMAADGSGSSYPIIFIMDLVGDCVIEDCSHCTVFVVGSSESVTVRRCTEMCLFLMAKEALFEYCYRMETHMLVTEYLLMDHCYQMNLIPLALEAPHLEEILASIIDGCSDESLRRILEHALSQKNEKALNVLLRAEFNGDAVDLEECVDIHIENNREQMILVDFVPSDVPLSSFFYEASQGLRQLSEWVVVPFLQKTWKKDKDFTHNIELPPVCLHDLVNAFILRLPGTLNPCAAPDGASPLFDVVLERISFGVVHLVEAVRTLIIRDCTGPLDIIVCSARRVIMESCENVTFQTACGAFTARNCHVCHVALHVNTPPRYEDCTFMQASTLNITSKDFESHLARAGVEIEVNLFDQPIVQCLHAEGDVRSSDKVPEMDAVDSVERARLILQRPVTFVAPLSATCLGIEDASFNGSLEDRVNHEAKARPCYDNDIIAAFSFLSHRQLMQSLTTHGPLKSAEIEEPRFVCLESPRITLMESQQVEERHFDPLVERIADDAGIDSFDAEEESSLPPALKPGSGVPQLPEHNPVTGTTDLSPRGNGFRVFGKDSRSERNRVPHDDYPCGDEETVDVVDAAMSAPNDDDDEGPTTDRKWCEMGGDKTIGEHQYPTEAQPVSRDSSLPQGTFTDTRLSADERESVMDPVTYPSAPRDGSVLDDRKSATEFMAAPLRRTGCESADEQSPEVVSSADGKKGIANVSLATSPPCRELALEVNNGNEKKSSCSSDKNVKNMSMPEQVFSGNALSFQNLILGVHPDEEEEVRSVLSRVAASREAMASARQASGSSTMELRRRVVEAVKRLQSNLK